MWDEGRDLREVIGGFFLLYALLYFSGFSHKPALLILSEKEIDFIFKLKQEIDTDRQTERDRETLAWLFVEREMREMEQTKTETEWEEETGQNRSHMQREDREME